MPPPKGEICVSFTAKGYSLCYDMDKDFDRKTGEIKPEAKAKRIPITDAWLNKRVSMDPDSYASLKAFILKNKYRCEVKP